MLTAFWPSVSWSGSLSDPQYDQSFQTYSATYLPENHWHLLKAQCYQESLLNPHAVSHVGAKGLCQFMPGTWRDVQRALKLRASVFNPHVNIRFAAYYMRRMKAFWKAERPDEPDRNNLALASYNAGAGHLAKAQKLCGGERGYRDIIRCLPMVTGRHSEETITYVERIRRWEGELK